MQLNGNNLGHRKIEDGIEVDKDILYRCLEEHRLVNGDRVPRKPRELVRGEDEHDLDYFYTKESSTSPLVCNHILVKIKENPDIEIPGVIEPPGADDGATETIGVADERSHYLWVYLYTKPQTGKRKLDKYKIQVDSDYKKINDLLVHPTMKGIAHIARGGKHPRKTKTNKRGKRGKNSKRGKSGKKGKKSKRGRRSRRGRKN